MRQAQQPAAVLGGERGERGRARGQRAQHARVAALGAQLQVAHQHAVHHHARRQAVGALCGAGSAFQGPRCNSAAAAHCVLLG